MASRSAWSSGSLVRRVAEARGINTRPEGDGAVLCAVVRSVGQARVRRQPWIRNAITYTIAFGNYPPTR
jgi:hypothetical protein